MHSNAGLNALILKQQLPLPESIALIGDECPAASPSTASGYLSLMHDSCAVAGAQYCVAEPNKARTHELHLDYTCRHTNTHTTHCEAERLKQQVSQQNYNKLELESNHQVCARSKD